VRQNTVILGLVGMTLLVAPLGRTQTATNAERWIWPELPPAAAALRQALPTLETNQHYAGSASCQACHEKEHASWHRSYHRTMTQPAMTNTVLGEFDGRTIESAGLQYRVYREGDRYFAEMPDPDVMMYIVQGGMKMAPEKVRRVTRPMVMTTGSHHYQTYWVSSERYPGLLQTLPLVYLLGDRRWIPREEAFMRGAHDTNRFIIQWNHQCIRCHSTGGSPGLNEKTGRLQSRVAELGISCEACHGPAQPHVDQQRALRATGGVQKERAAVERFIVNPSLLDHRRSSEICGQCHGAYVLRPEFSMTFARDGAPYRPGDELFRTREELVHPRIEPTPERIADFRANREYFREQWWDDGTILAGGREFTGLSASKCYSRGKLSCLSCHTMHRGEPNDQLKPGRDGAAACTDCHAAPQYTTEVERHTHHRAGSTGSNCLNCHMPHTSYALFKAIRSHQIEAPRTSLIARYGTPNACNLCHLDKTLGWTQDHLAKWFGQARQPLQPEYESTSAAILWLLQGHAAQRVIAAWHVGWKPAQDISGQRWAAPWLAQLLNDPSGVVRYVAAASLRSLPGFADFKYDFLSATGSLATAVSHATERWRNEGGPPDRKGRAVLLETGGWPDTNRATILLRARDNRPVTIQE
jgi:predicted CXXCH cytochrome family protein